MVKLLKSYFTYSYLTYDEEKTSALLVDPAWDYMNIKNNLAGLPLQGILLTHHHYDHVNLADKIARQWNVPVFMSREEIDFYHFRCLNLHAIENEEPIRFGNCTIKPFLTPGHTKGGMCYKTENAVFSGDTIFIEGCGMCDLDGGSPYEMYETITRCKELFNGTDIVYPGHSYGEQPGKSMDFLLSNNIYFNLDDRDKFVEFRMRKNQKGLFSFK